MTMSFRRSTRRRTRKATFDRKTISLRRACLESLERRELLSAQADASAKDTFGLTFPAIESRSYEADDYYRSSGERIELARRTTEFVVKLNEAQRDAALLSSLANGYVVTRKLDDATYVVQAVPTALREGIVDFAASNAVAWWQPMFVDRTTGKRLAIIDEMVVCIESGYTAEEVLGESGYTYRKLRGSTDQFIVSLPDGGAFALDTAHRLRKTPASHGLLRISTRTFA